ncbi:VWA domain-containing protein [Crocosphaera sp. UHCC 0190]|uniref:VWA domain-containing protein n=1 Tax=Crocosphaera sp. UHCC 0190 TaxID=3110246 RepID=UPI002B21BFC6|nr:VWA domain-containing protein [Crocosphaera sp. UHCC 0190]MEA5510888.1 VWA domain-containing protein [Crocosphaera sp. UHCC 0190]
MNTDACLTLTPGEPLTYWQRAGLALISHLHGGRDVILAIDLTGSVDFNEEGQTRLHQIIQDSLRSGDSVYVVPFAAEINPLTPNQNSWGEGIKFQGKQEDIEAVFQKIPLESNANLRNTDIQKAELFVYRKLAQLNQCRLLENQPVKFQSVVWITEAPLLTESGISSDTWIETPADSPFRQKQSPESQERQGWIQALPLNQRSQTITTNNIKNYQLTIVDVPPTIQEFCTPAPGGKETCLVNAYLLQELWLPVLVFGIFILGSIWGIKYFLSLQKPWNLEVIFPSDEDREKQKCVLKNQQRIPIGDEDLSSIYCPGGEIRGYLERRGNYLYLNPTKQAPIYYRGKETLQKIKLEQQTIKINCPEQSKGDQDFDIVISIINK